MIPKDNKMLASQTASVDQNHEQVGYQRPALGLNTKGRTNNKHGMK
jgi:hypothetical protein